jgi:ribosomal-protein-alanine N-acetyltransferase
MENSEAIELTPVTISSKIISLEPISMAGLDDFHEYSVKPELYKYFEIAQFQLLEESEAYLQKLIDRAETPYAQYWFIKLNKNDKVIGSIGIHSFNANRNSVEIGYAISPSYWGKGYFREALKLTIEYVFNDLCLHRIVAITSALNSSSISGLEKFGFLKEAIMQDYYRDFEGKWFDAALMALINKNQKLS